MMRIKSDDSTIIIPVNSGLHIIYENNIKDELLTNLNSYFGQKKKTKCIVFNEDNELISPKDAEFIYISSKENLDNIFNFKSKTLLNDSIENFIDENPNMFCSIDRIREELRNLLTDKGMFKIKRVLEYGTNINLNFETTNFAISKILQNLIIDVSYIKQSEQFIILYNLLLFINRNKFNVVYIDFPIDNDSIDWLKSIESNNNIILVSNESIEDYMAKEFESMIILTNNNFVEQIDLEKEKSSLLSYALHPIVFNHPEYQNEKIVEIIDMFTDKTTCFFVKFITNNTLNYL